MKTNLLLALTALLLSVCAPANAATECYFEKTHDAVDLNINNLVFQNVVAPKSGYTVIKPTGSMSITPTDDNITSNCDLGQGGQALRGKNNRAGSTDYKYATVTDANGNSHQAVLYSTTAPGIYYAIKITNDACADNSGFIPANNSYLNLYDVGDSREKQCMNGVKHFTFGVQFYVGSDYKGAKGTFKSNEVVHGSFNISGAVDEVTVKTVIFTATLK
ncbi:hypothetical protein BCh11DRAFT_05978 [Burkholderia sp. Ch1-1]|uniref:Fimbrial protein n=1 Tax=Paraburkholderia dioscoreae TaxID=2604047 RepID=A0A5Q4ZDQ3_9BURK|nr:MULTISPECIES: hypothetical protein [Paraburkholderia]EIF30488.1 hypothetical protein BCh11DRAFT_05978 [Burkholderia sp. Ch1-1]MDR8395088.1 hypothetical protein [Paraburkholderia sp. USG1]VVD29417.1 conserved exported protein of unknown function [Paraburkholderia dioscoreae]